MLIGAVEEAAKKRLNAQCVEVVPRHFIAPGLGWILARIQPYRREDVRCQTIEAAVAIAQIEIVGIRSTLVLIGSALECVEALRMGHIQRPQDQRIQYAEDHGVRADRQRQRQNRGDRESRRLAQHAKAEAHILQKGLDKIAAQRFVAFLSVPFSAAELDARPPFRLGASQARAFQIIRAELDMRAKLFFHLRVRSETDEKAWR